MNIAIINLGCKVNRVEADLILSQFLKFGWEESSPQDAQVVVINTCTVTAQAAKKTRKTIRRAARESSAQVIAVTGCAAALDTEAIEAIDPRIVVQTDKTKVVDACFDRIAYDERVFTGPVDDAPLLRIGKEFPTRVGVKIQDGCNNACTYCIVHVARGKSWSRPSEEILREVCAYERAGVREIILTGINLGSYREEGMRLPGLLQQILDATSELRVRISSIEPRDVSDELIDLMAQSEGRICAHLHLPLQAGSDKVLRDMARPYRVEFYKNLVDKLKTKMPQISLSTDIICGFPGETEEEFQETLDMVEYVGYSKVHIFPYSLREGTRAALRTDQVAPQVKEKRVRQLAELSAQMREADWSRRAGSEELVIIEASGKAMTESYYEIKAPEGAELGSLVRCVLPDQPLLSESE